MVKESLLTVREVLPNPLSKASDWLRSVTLTFEGFSKPSPKMMSFSCMLTCYKGENKTLHIKQLLSRNPEKSLSEL